MGAVRGAMVSSIGLVLLYDVSTSKSGNVGTLFGLPGRVADYIINPGKPLIPDLRASSKTPPGKVLGQGTLPGNPLGQALGSSALGLLGISLQQPTPSAPAPAPPASSSSSSSSGGILV